MEKTKTRKRLAGSVALIVVLSGRELGEYDRLIEEDEFLFEPGMTVQKAFSV